ncbi:5115_t:CDS:10 [Funneliformis geosporum]|uniref:5115_t:CDS:1 n=1 Tax=Funneliformis geosporum TaxID=1117311 RepID=A0A9W4SG58_9GLOM|nr:5115_t:CDS:10 [Funneliformis geosporum]
MPRQRINRTGHRTKRFKNQSSINSSQLNPIDSSDTSPQQTPKEIAGYYYDHEKNRYFKIMPNKTVGSSHPFSADSIGTKTKKAEEVKVIKFSSAMSLLFDREINPNKPINVSKSENRQILVKSLRQIGTIKTNTMERLYIKDFRIHPSMNKIFYGDTSGVISQIKFKCASESCVEDYNIQMLNFSSEITSMRLERTNLLIGTSLGDPVSSGVMFVAKVCSEIDPYGLEPKYAYNSRSTIWTSSFSEIDSSIAVGSSQKLSVIQGWQETPFISNFKTYSDVFALDFDRYQPNVVFSGCRDGRLRIFDLRSDSRHGIGPMIDQKSPICHLKQIGAWYILSDGMNGSVSLWDIRNEKKNYDKAYDNKPVIEFEKNVNSTNIQYGFDINLKEDILSIAGQDNKVRFFSINTGRAIRPPIGPFKDKIPALRFCTWDPSISNPKLDERGEGIWIASGEELQWWSVGNDMKQD